MASSEANVHPTSTTNFSQIRTVRVSNVSTAVTDKVIWEFFSFSGDIHYIEMESESETTQHAFITFKDSQGAERAVLLTGATIANLTISISPVENYQLPPEAPPLTPEETEPPDRKQEVVRKAEDVASTMLAKGFVLGKDALKKARSFDERHHFTSNASATVASLDRRMGLTQKISIGTAVMNEKMKEMDERYQVAEATKSAIATAEQKASNAGSALMSNRYVSSGAVWVSGAFAALAKAAEDVGSKTKEKVDKAEEEEKEALYKETTNIANDYAQVHVDESSIEDRPKTPPVKSLDDNNKETTNIANDFVQVHVDQSSIEDPPKTLPVKSLDDNNETTNTINDFAQVPVDQSSIEDPPKTPPVKSLDDNNKETTNTANDFAQVHVDQSSIEDPPKTPPVKSLDDKNKETTNIGNDFAQVHIDQSSIEDPPKPPVKSLDDNKETTNIGNDFAQVRIDQSSIEDHPKTPPVESLDDSKKLPDI